MRPQVTIKTSGPLQREILETADDEDEMESLRTHRDDLVDRFAEDPQVLDHMEDVAGLEFKQLSLDVWVYEGKTTPISSPLLIPVRDDIEVQFFELIYMLSKELLYQNLRSLTDHEMLESGFEQLDVTAGLIAYGAMERITDTAHVEDILETASFGGEHLKTWRAVRDHAEKFAPADETVIEYFGIEKQEEETGEEA